MMICKNGFYDFEIINLLLLRAQNWQLTWIVEVVEASNPISMGAEIRTVLLKWPPNWIAWASILRLWRNLVWQGFENSFRLPQVLPWQDLAAARGWTWEARKILVRTVLIKTSFIRQCLIRGCNLRKQRWIRTSVLEEVQHRPLDLLPWCQIKPTTEETLQAFLRTVMVEQRISIQTTMWYVCENFDVTRLNFSFYSI